MAKIRLVDSLEHPVRLAFAQNLFTAGTVAGEGKPAYSVTAIFPKDHPVHKELTAAEEQVAKEKWGEKAPAILKAIRADAKRGPVAKNGDSKSEYSGFEGNSFVSMRSDKRPNVYNKDGSQLTESDGVVYSGCYAHVMLEVWAQDNSYGKRINAQVTGVMFSRDGDSFGGGAAPAPADAFADLSAADEDMLS
jgi:hypothetical protein